MKALIQHNDISNQKLILQALVPFIMLKDSVLFTYRANTAREEDKSSQFKSSIDFYQRRVDAKRANDIKSFIWSSIVQEKKGDQLATLFPTSMILALSANNDSDDDGNIVVPHSDGSCELEIRTNVFIVDGQHRMMGMIRLYNELKQRLVRNEEEEYVFDFLENYKFNCVVLVNFDLWEQGQVFVNVNFKQKPVNKSLYYEIFGSEYRENASEWNRNKIYIAHSVTKKLNEHPESPFYHRIKMLGVGEGYISQAFVVESLLKLFKKGGLWYFDAADDNSETGTSYYATELLSYFFAIKHLFSAYWPKAEDKRGTIICKTTGFGAWVRLMGMMRSDNDQLLLTQLKKSAEIDEICEEYVNHVTVLLNPLTGFAEVLFGDHSSFKSSTGQGSEVKLFKKMLFYLQNPMVSSNGQNKYPFDINVLNEQIQEYMWSHSIDDLEYLGHHREIEEISGLSVNRFDVKGDTLTAELSFYVYVSIYIDNEDDLGFGMRFPATGSVVMEKRANLFELDQESVHIHVNTDTYYQ